MKQKNSRLARFMKAVGLGGYRAEVEERRANSPRDLERLLVDQLRVASGVAVNETTSMRVAAVHACVRILSDCVSSLPVHLYEKRPDNAELTADNHRANYLVAVRPNAAQTPCAFMRTIMAHLATKGNAFVEKVGFDTSFPQLVPRHPSLVRVHADPDIMSINYSIRRADNMYAPVTADKIIHIRSGVSLDGITGLSPIEAAAQSIGVSLAAEEFGGRTFANSAKPSGVFSIPTALSDEAYMRLRESLADDYQGTSNAGRPMLLENGLTWTATSMTPSDVQFLETRKFQRSEIAMFFGIPPHMLGDVDKATSWGSGIEQQGLGFVTYTLKPYLKIIAEALAYGLLSHAELTRYKFKFDTGDLTRADYLSRQNALAIQHDRGVITTNEWRRAENLNPLDGGDQPGRGSNINA